MSDYQYIDFDGVRMNIDGYTTNINLYLTERNNRVSTIIPTTHAPAVALAILEASGYGKTEAAGFVRGKVEDLVKKIEQEREDADVIDFFTKFDGLTPAFISDHDRRRYRAARKFFEESK